MPSAWMIGPLVLKSSLVMLLLSFGLGFIFFQTLSPFTKEQTKERSQEISSLLIAFVVFLWIGKIALNFSMFLNDPRAILAYPSDSNAFYIAVFLTILYAGFKMIQSREHLFSLLLSWMYVFLFTSFVYQFVEVVWGGNRYGWAYLGLLVVLLISVTLVQHKLSIETMAFATVFWWSLGQWGLTFIAPYTTIFLYTITPPFFIVLVVVLSILFFYNRREKVKQ